MNKKAFARQETCLRLANAFFIGSLTAILSPAKWPLFHAKPTKRSGENDSWNQQKRQISGTNPLDSFNNINGIVEQNQWNCSTKSMELFNKTNVFVSQKRQFDFLKPTIRLRRFVNLPAAIHQAWAAVAAVRGCGNTAAYRTFHRKDLLFSFLRL